MKRALVPGLLVLLLALSACSGGETTGEQAEATPAATTAQAGAQSVETDAPLAASTPAVSESSDEATFVADVRAKLRPDNVIPDATDEQLIAAGENACEQLKTAQTSNDISVIENEPKNGAGRYSDSAVIVSAARATICD